MTLLADTDAMKQAAARAALAYVPDGAIVGVGTGSTTNFFIAELAKVKHRIAGAVASSRASAELLRALGLPLVDLNRVDEMPIYVDGADEITRKLQMIKGGGGALTGEKIVASVAKTFICIADRSKLKEQLGAFPLPVEVIPLARSAVARALARMGGQSRLREGFATDYGNLVLDVRGLPMLDPAALEAAIDQIPGVVTNGLFARRPADLLLLGTVGAVEALRA
jgi:ribose 5-phosphate isomerase A